MMTMETATITPPTIPYASTFGTFSEVLDLSPILFKLIKEKGWSPEKARAIEPQYKAFFFLLGTGGDFLVPSVDIDEMWHAHILDTRKYMADCAELFGEYIHHYPYLGMKDEADEKRAAMLYAATCNRISGILGQDVTVLELADCGGGGGCSGGGSSCSSSSSCSSGPVSHCSSKSNIPPSGGDVGWISPIPASCGSTDRSRDDRREKREEPRRTPDRPAEKRKPLYRRILGLSGISDDRAWLGSVTPEHFAPEYRPDAEALAALSPELKTQH